MDDKLTDTLHAGACLTTQGERGFPPVRTQTGFHHAFSRKTAEQKGNVWGRGGARSSHRTTECSNCGDVTHMFRACPHPVISIGIIAVRYPSDNFELLMIQRKDSLGYVELLRGKYEVSDVNYIVDLMSEMTRDELVSIQELSFDDLWDSLWNRQASRQYKHEYEASRTKWQRLMNGVVDASGTLLTLADLIARIRTPGGGWPTPEWGFPKGRRNSRESDLRCAAREFQEETGLTSEDYTIINTVAPLQETFVGSNKVHYCHKYYVALCKPDCHAHVDTDNSVQRREVGDIRWVTPDAGIALIRPYDTTKCELVHRVKSTLQSLATT